MGGRLLSRRLGLPNCAAWQASASCPTQKLESEIQEKRKMLCPQKEALSLLQPLFISVLGESTKVVTLEPDFAHHRSIGISFQGGIKVDSFKNRLPKVF
jgi:hypothetical protein